MPHSRSSPPRRRPLSAALFPLLGCLSVAGAQVDVDATDAPAAGATANELAQQLANPIANLISVPLQNNFDFDAGPSEDGFRYTLNVQPVIPVALGDDWNLITRTIVPIIGQNDEFSALTTDSEFGLGDTVASFFLSPKDPVALSETANLTWGVGPVLYLPTATEDVLGADQFGLGPTGVALVVDGPWTYGGLLNHVWSVGETEDFDSFVIDRPEINATFLQPFVTYAPGGGWSFTATSETTFNWESEDWTIPANFTAAKVLQLGGQTVSVAAGPRIYLEAADTAPEWGFRLQFTFIFPR